MLRKVYRYYRNVRANILGRLCPKYLAGNIYKNVFKKELDWENPEDLNEKIQWLKFYSDTSLWSVCADKYKVRDYIAQKGFSDILVNLYGRWDNANQIDFDKLPNQFVLKTNHGSGDVIIVRDKSSLDIPKIRKKLNNLLHEVYGVRTVEPHYRRIKPCVMAEELLTNNCAFSDSLVDYKIWCFNGRPHHIWACYNRTKNYVYVETHDLQWNYIPEASVFYDSFREGGGRIPKPSCLDYMLKVASSLSEGFPEVRVDLYEVNNKVYFGEMTFTSQGGYMEFYSKEYLKEMGNLVVLPNK